MAVMNIVNIFVSIYDIGESYEESEHIIIFFSEKYHKLVIGSNRISGYMDVNTQNILFIKFKWYIYVPIWSLIIVPQRHQRFTEIICTIIVCYTLKIIK